jgi:hypothetical protein
MLAGGGDPPMRTMRDARFLSRLGMDHGGIRRLHDLAKPVDAP